MPGSGRPIAPIRVATGEHVQNRVLFKQLFQAGAIDVCQIDACRVGGVNEVLAIILMAAKFGVPVCPHAGGVGLCEYVQHLAVFDYVSVSCSLEDRVVEWVDHLHEHFRHPAVVGRRPLPGTATTPATASRCCPSRSRSTHSRTAPLWAATEALCRAEMTEVAEPMEHPESLGRPRLDPGIPPAAGGASRSPRRAGADPPDPRRRRQPDDACLLHEPQHRERLLPDRRDRACSRSGSCS